MTNWQCGIRDCNASFDGPEPLVKHQAIDHQARDCKVCDTQLPAGYLAIRHVFEEHTRADYVRAYNADSDDIRLRENIKEHVEATIDVGPVIDDLDDSVTSAGAEG